MGTGRDGVLEVPGRSGSLIHFHIPIGQLKHFHFHFANLPLAKAGGGVALRPQVGMGCTMLNENTLDQLTQMMDTLATRSMRRRLTRAGDLLCWTPLAPMIRAARRARIIAQTRELRMRQHAAEICEEVRREHADLLIPAWS